ncbi:MAG TPA: hypothetical protein VE685_27785 [Thermoanaerobaculia bacterium]|nr:hypothetical protein [Thermoanaerobaculia bacterium]
MIRFSAIALLLAAALPALALQTSAPGASEPAYRRVELKPTQGEGKALPYTVEIPADWQVRQETGYPGLWLGPADARPPESPKLIYVRGSLVSLADPEKVAASIRANDAKEGTWTAPRVEVMDLGGVRGVLVRMDSGEGDKARSTLALKLPLESTAVDFMASASRGEFEKMLPVYEKILLSVRPVAPAPQAQKQ